VNVGVKHKAHTQHIRVDNFTVPAFGSKHDGLVLALTYDVMCEFFQEAGIFSLVDGAKNGCGSPSVGVHYRTISYFALKVISRNVRPIGRGVDNRLTHHAHC